MKNLFFNTSPNLHGRGGDKNTPPVGFSVITLGIINQINENFLTFIFILFDTFLQKITIMQQVGVKLCLKWGNTVSNSKLIWLKWRQNVFGHIFWLKSVFDLKFSTLTYNKIDINFFILKKNKYDVINSKWRLDNENNFVIFSAS